jgi:hypothetical protein
MAECDLAIHEPTLGHTRIEGKHDELVCTSLRGRQLRAARGSSSALASSSSLAKSPVYRGLSTSKRRQSGMFHVSKPLDRERYRRADLVKVHSSDFIRALEALYIFELTEDMTYEQVRRDTEMQSRPDHLSALRLFGRSGDGRGSFSILQCAGGGVLYKHVRREQ